MDVAGSQVVSSKKVGIFTKYKPLQIPITAASMYI